MNKTWTLVGITAATALVSAAVMLSYATVRDKPGMSGVIVSWERAALDVVDQPGDATHLRIDRVMAPGDSWVVVRRVMMGPVRGMMSEPAPKPSQPATEPPPLAVVHVPAGETRDLVIPLGPGIENDRMVFVVLHADSGTTGKFEFDMDRFVESPDKPYYRTSPGGMYGTLQMGRTVMVRR